MAGTIHDNFIIYSLSSKRVEERKKRNEKYKPLASS
jgi:hypothetical protein